MAWVQRYSAQDATGAPLPADRFSPELVGGGRATLALMIGVAGLLIVDYFVPLQSLL